MSEAQPMDNDRRVDIYLMQGGKHRRGRRRDLFTPRQRRRLTHKRNRELGKAGLR